MINPCKFYDLASLAEASYVFYGSSAESVGQMEAPGWADQLIPS